MYGFRTGRSGISDGLLLLDLAPLALHASVQPSRTTPARVREILTAHLDGLLSP
jgi:hypothetical protein